MRTLAHEHAPTGAHAHARTREHAGVRAGVRAASMLALAMGPGWWYSQAQSLTVQAQSLVQTQSLALALALAPALAPAVAPTQAPVTAPALAPAGPHAQPSFYTNLFYFYSSPPSPGGCLTTPNTRRASPLVPRDAPPAPMGAAARSFPCGVGGAWPRTSMAETTSYTCPRGRSLRMVPVP